MKLKKKNRPMCLKHYFSIVVDGKLNDDFLA